ncbi:MAG: 30S ribosomal protein S19e [archaeon]
MPTVYDVDANSLIEKAAQELKKVESIQAPKWAVFVKTGHSKQRPPENSDWWYHRSASILRKVYLRGPLGVSKLRTNYGSKKNRGHAPEHRYRASGKIIRVMLQQLEAAGFIKQTEKKGHKGRFITPKGKAFLDGVGKTLKK